jgi:hypothetical protein
MFVIGHPLKSLQGHLNAPGLGASLLVAGPLLDEALAEFGTLFGMKFRICQELLVAGDEELRLLRLNESMLLLLVEGVQQWLILAVRGGQGGE